MVNKPALKLIQSIFYGNNQSLFAEAPPPQTIPLRIQASSPPAPQPYWLHLLFLRLRLEPEVAGKSIRSGDYRQWREAACWGSSNVQQWRRPATEPIDESDTGACESLGETPPRCSTNPDIARNFTKDKHWFYSMTMCATTPGCF